MSGSLLRLQINLTQAQTFHYYRTREDTLTLINWSPNGRSYSFGRHSFYQHICLPNYYTSINRVATVVFFFYICSRAQRFSAKKTIGGCGCGTRSHVICQDNTYCGEPLVCKTYCFWMGGLKWNAKLLRFAILWKKKGIYFHHSVGSNE